MKSINETKEDLWASLDGDKTYNPFITNRGMSMFPDTLFHANEMNQLWSLPKELQYRYYLQAVKPARRYSGKWPKPSTSDAVKMISDVYCINTQRAMELASFLTPKQLEIIKKRHDKGGT